MAMQMGANTLSGPGQDPLNMRLGRVVEVLAGCHTLVEQIVDRMDGPSPQKPTGSAPMPSGISAVVMVLTTQSQELQARLERLLSQL